MGVGGRSFSQAQGIGKQAQVLSGDTNGSHICLLGRFLILNTSEIRSPEKEEEQTTSKAAVI